MTLPMPGGSRAAISVRLLGVPVRVHLGFLAIAALIGSRLGGLTGTAAGTAIVLLAVLAHELGHAAAVQTFGLQPSVELYWLGGVTSYQDARMLSRRRRIIVAAAGPFAGAAVGAAAWLAGMSGGGVRHAAASLAFGVGVILGLLNLAPVLPLDGGRVLADLPTGNPARRLKVARMLSIGFGALAILVAYLLGELVVGLFSAWLVWENLKALRAESVPQSLIDDLTLALSRLDADSAGEAEELAIRALRLDEQVVQVYAATLLVAAHLVRERYDEARQVAGDQDLAVVGAYRDLAVLGKDAPAVLEARLAGDPGGGDVRAAAVLFGLRGEWDRLAELACSPLGAHLDGYWSLDAQTRAFRRGAFECSALIGQAAEERGVAGPVERYDIACAWARAGAPEAAVAALDRAATAGWGDVETLDGDDDFDSIRDLPAYAEVRGRMAKGRVGPADGERRHPRYGAALGLLGCGVLSAALVRGLPETVTSWFPYGFGSSPYNTGVTEVVGLDLHTGELRWRAGLDARVPSISPAGPNVAVGELPTWSPAGLRSDLHLRILDPLSGRLVVTLATTGHDVVAAGDGIALVVDNQDATGVVRAVDTDTGVERWFRRIGADTVTVVAGVAMVTAFEGGPGLRAIELTTGRDLWRRDDLMALRGSPPANPVVLARTEEADRVVGLDPRTGTERWEVPLDGFPTVVSTNVWSLDPSAELTLIDAATGARRTVPVDVPTTHPLVGVGDTAVVVTEDGIAAIDLASGRSRWSQRAPRTIFQARIIDEVVVTEWGGGMVAYDVATGRPLWRNSADVTSLTLADGVVLLGRADGMMEARRASDGEVLWSAPAKGTSAPPEVIGSTVVLARR